MFTPFFGGYALVIIIEELCNAHRGHGGSDLRTCTGNSLISTPLIPDGRKKCRNTQEASAAPADPTVLCSLLAFCEEKIAHGADIFRGLVNVHDAGLCLTMAK